jgi:5S rRNA maturation endonuclease (ribonuclease M5)
MWDLETLHKLNHNRQQSRVVARYDYNDEGGALLYQVEKLEPKGFRQRRPNGNGGWVWKTADVRKVLYRLPDLIEAIASEQVVVVVEGEKDVESLRKIGVPATCNAGGASEPGKKPKWRAEYSKMLHGADVVIIPDHDEAGRAHAEAIMQMSTGIAKRVRVLELAKHWPECPKGGDVSDWLAANHSREELDTLIEQAPDYEPQENEQATTGLGEWDAGDDVDLPPPRGWLLGNIFARGFMSSLLAEGGVGKTALRYAQLLSLATGRSLTGDHVFQRCKVLIISLEDDDKELRRRILATRLHYKISLSAVKGWLFLSAPGADAGKLMIANARGHVVRGSLGDNIEDAVVKRGIDIVSIDPFVKSHSVEENNNSAIDDVVQILTDLGAKYHIAIDAPHHTSKGIAEPGNANRGRGASAMKDAGRLVYTLAGMSEDEAKAFGVAEEKCRLLIRMDSGKVNITPPMRAAKWFRLVGVSLGNATDIYPHGDEVQTVEAWEPPDTWADLSTDLLNRVLTDIDAGLPDGTRYSDAPRATRGAWQVILEHAPHKTEAQAREIIRVKNGVLVSRKYHNPVTRKDAMGLHLDAAKRPGHKLHEVRD